ncbi:hypothetical protein [Gordonia aichiensis]
MSADDDRPLLVVDAANVVGSVPDGWWRDRRAATERLLDRIADLPTTGLADLPGPLDVVVVVEGAARGARPRPGIRVVDAPGSGDDTIVDVVSSDTGRAVTVVTSDRELRSRVEELGADAVGPRTIR